MANKLVIVLTSYNVDNPTILRAPLIHAAVAASMSVHVDFICVGAGMRLLCQGVAGSLYMKCGEASSVYDFIKEAYAAGVVFHCSAPGLDLYDIHETDMVPECSGVLGAAHYVEKIMAEDVRVISY